MLLYHIKEVEGIKVITFSGDLTAATVTKIKDEIQQTYRDLNEPKIIFDLQDVEFLDSSGIGFLVAVLKELSQKNCKLKLANLNSALENTLKQVQLYSFFEIYETLEEAIESFY